MDNRAECNQTPPDLTQPKEILKKLLAIELDRLDTAVRIEQERKIVFPETTVIIRDIQKLNAAINGRVGNKADDLQIDFPEFQL